MKHILNTLEKFLVRRGAHCRINSEGSLLHVYIHGANGAWVCQAVCDLRHNEVVFHSVFPFKVPRRYRSAVSGLLASLNHDQSAVCFEKEPATGIACCRSSIPLTACGHRATLEDAVLTNILATDTHLPIIKQVLHGRMTVRQALAKAHAMKG